MRKIITSIILLSIAIFSVAGCSWVKPYRVDIQQGNIIDQKEVKQLQIGMNKNEVQNLLGTPVLACGFDGDHWTYAYTNQINGGKIEKKVVDLYFYNNRLVKINNKTK